MKKSMLLTFLITVSLCVACSGEQKECDAAEPSDCELDDLEPTSEAPSSTEALEENACYASVDCEASEICTRQFAYGYSCNEPRPTSDARCYFSEDCSSNNPRLTHTTNEACDEVNGQWITPGECIADEAPCPSGLERMDECLADASCLAWGTSYCTG